MLCRNSSEFELILLEEGKRVAIWHSMSLLTILSIWLSERFYRARA